MSLLRFLRRYKTADMLPTARDLIQAINTARTSGRLFRHANVSPQELATQLAEKIRPAHFNGDLSVVRALVGPNQETEQVWRYQANYSTNGSLVVASRLWRVAMRDGSRRWIADWNGFICESCDGRFPRWEHGSRNQCDNCRRREQVNNRPILGPHANVLDAYPDVAQKVDAHTAESGLLFGVELEIEVSRKARRAGANINDLAHKVKGENPVIIKHDGSLNFGFEINTVPAPLKKQRAIVQQLTRTMPKRTFMASKNCGLHVHVSRVGMTQETAARLIVLVNAPTMQGLIRHVARRSSSQWARVYPKDYFQAAGELRGTGNKYVALNTEHTHTLEFRIFKSSLSQATINAALEFCAVAVDYAAQTVSIETLVSPEKFCEYVARRKRDFKNLYRWLGRSSIAKPVFENAANQREIELCA